MATAIDQAVTQLAGPSVEAFVEQVLQDERTNHDAWIDAILHNESVRQRTVPLVHDLYITAPGPELTLSSRPPPRASAAPTLSPQTRSSMRRYAALAILALTLGLGAAAIQIARTKPEPVRIEAIVPDAIPAEAAPQVPPPAESGSEPAQETKPVPVAQPRPRTRPRRLPAAAPAKPDAVAGDAWVTLAAEPFAVVRLDGVNLGPTPILKRKIPAGTHQVEFLKPETGEVRFKQEIQLEKEQRLTIRAP